MSNIFDIVCYSCLYVLNVLLFCCFIIYMYYSVVLSVTGASGPVFGVACFSVFLKGSILGVILGLLCVLSTSSNCPHKVLSGFIN